MPHATTRTWTTTCCLSCCTPSQQQQTQQCPDGSIIPIDKTCPPTNSNLYHRTIAAPPRVLAVTAMEEEAVAITEGIVIAGTVIRTIAVTAMEASNQ